MKRRLVVSLISMWNKWPNARMNLLPWAWDTSLVTWEFSRYFLNYRGAVAQLVERPLKVPGRSDSADMSSNLGCGIRWQEKILGAPFVEQRNNCLEIRKKTIKSYFFNPSTLIFKPKKYQTIYVFLSTAACLCFSHFFQVISFSLCLGTHSKQTLVGLGMKNTRPSFHSKQRKTRSEMRARRRYRVKDFFSLLWDSEKFYELFFRGPDFKLRMRF